MPKKNNELNSVAALIIESLEAKCGHCGAAYISEKRKTLSDLDRAESLFWASYNLDSSVLLDFAERLGVTLADVKAAGRVLRSIY